VDNWQSIIIFAIVVVALFYITGRSRRRETPRLAMALNAMSNVNDNMQVLRMHLADRQNTKKFKNNALSEPAERLNFLDAETLTALKETYSLTVEFNQKIEDARKAQAPSTLQDLPFDKMIDPLNKSKAGLVSWYNGNRQSESVSPRRNLFGF
jgi:hypothetical protein